MPAFIFMVFTSNHEFNQQIINIQKKIAELF